VAAALLGVIIKQLALRALPDSADGVLPPGLAERLGLAWVGAGQVFGVIGQRMAQMSGDLSLVLIIVVVGAVAGALFYLLREDLLRVPWPPWGHKKAKRVRRRRAR
jgi:hypothetical protein